MAKYFRRIFNPLTRTACCYCARYRGIRRIRASYCAARPSQKRIKRETRAASCIIITHRTDPIPKRHSKNTKRIYGFRVRIFFFLILYANVIRTVRVLWLMYTYEGFPSTRNCGVLSASCRATSNDAREYEYRWAPNPTSFQKRLRKINLYILFIYVYVKIRTALLRSRTAHRVLGAAANILCLNFQKIVDKSPQQQYTYCRAPIYFSKSLRLCSVHCVRFNPI